MVKIKGKKLKYHTAYARMLWKKFPDKMRAYKREYEAKRTKRQKQKRKKYLKGYWKKNKLRIKKQRKLFFKKNPQKWIALWKFKNAKVSGKVKSKPCEVCKDKNSQGHHRDYSKPFEVIWLCQKHHSQEHALIRNLSPCSLKTKYQL